MNCALDVDKGLLYMTLGVPNTKERHVVVVVVDQDAAGAATLKRGRCRRTTYLTSSLRLCVSISDAITPNGMFDLCCAGVRYPGATDLPLPHETTQARR